jgi:hypothetical protein
VRRRGTRARHGLRAQHAGLIGSRARYAGAVGGLLMKRLAWMVVVGLLGVVSPGFAAYDGPTPLITYDQTLSSIRVVMTSQAKILNASRSRFVVTAEVPIVAANVGRQVVLQARLYLGGDPIFDEVLGSCSNSVAAGDVGKTLTYSCEMFEYAGLSLSPGDTVQVYPYVVRNATNPGGELVHDGRAGRITVPVVGEDAREQNDTQFTATVLSVAPGSPATDIDLVGADADYFRFTAPFGAASADITIEFWNSANDLDLFLYDAGGNEIGGSFSSADQERVIIDIIGGETYYFQVRGAFEDVPTFYDLSVAVGAAHSLSYSGPTGTPDPVIGGQPVSMTFSASDSLGHALSYDWSANCPDLPSPGSFNDRKVPSPIWTAPLNQTGLQRTCSLRVSVSDGINLSLQRIWLQFVDPTADVVTISSGPGGTPNPVASEGSVALSVVAADSYGHALSYAWVAECPSLGDNGFFTPSAVVPTPTWNAPANTSGDEETCTLSVTVSDGLGQSAAGNFVQAVASQGSFTYYFAEGATINGFFDTRLALLNVDATDTANVSIDFQLKDTTTVLRHSFNISPERRATVDVGQLGSDSVASGGQSAALAPLTSAEFSMVVTSTRPLVVDRTMTWDASGYGSHAENSVASPASTWYLAEGATIGDFELYYLIQNPNPEPIQFQVTYLLPPPAAPIVRSYPVGANTRTNVAVHAESGLENVEVSAIIESPVDKPIIVERAMYLTTGGLFYGAGHESAGIRAPATQWFFAEGATGSFFDLFILVGNPNDTPAEVTATFLFDDGTTCSTTAPVGAKSRFNIWVDATVIDDCPRDLGNAALSTTLTSDIPVIAERSMWWPGTGWAEVHNSAGATETGPRWALADGEQGGARANETYILIANASAFAGTARVTLYFQDGTAPLSKDVSLPANSRTSVPVGAPVEVGGFGDAVVNKQFGAVVESLPVPGEDGPADIVVERAMYSNGPGAPFWAAGTNLLGTKLP